MQGSVANMLRSLLVIGAIMSLFVFVFPRVQPVPPDINVAETAEQVHESTGLPISVPANLPEGWVPMRAQYVQMGDGIMTWVAGFETPEGEYAALQQAQDATAEWVKTQVNNAPPDGTMMVDGREWAVFEREGSRAQRSIADHRGAGELSTVITGSATWDELTVLWESLEPVAGS